MSKIKVGEIYSYMGSTSLGVFVEKASAQSTDGKDQAWIEPLCGSYKWMNLAGHRNTWLIDIDNLREVPEPEKELCRLLYNEQI